MFIYVYILYISLIPSWKRCSVRLGLTIHSSSREIFTAAIICSSPEAPGRSRTLGSQEWFNLPSLTQLVVIKRFAFG